MLGFLHVQLLLLHGTFIFRRKTLTKLILHLAEKLIEILWLLALLLPCLILRFHHKLLELLRIDNRRPSVSLPLFILRLLDKLVVNAGFALRRRKPH